MFSCPKRKVANSSEFIVRSNRKLKLCAGILPTTHYPLPTTKRFALGIIEIPVLLAIVAFIIASAAIIATTSQATAALTIARAGTPNFLRSIPPVEPGANLELKWKVGGDIDSCEAESIPELGNWIPGLPAIDVNNSDWVGPHGVTVQQTTKFILVCFKNGQEAPGGSSIIDVEVTSTPPPPQPTPTPGSTPPPPPGSQISCSPKTTTASLNQPIYFTASGPQFVTYVWSAPEGSPNASSGAAGFETKWATPGTKTVNVSVAGAGQDTCTVEVTGQINNKPSDPTTPSGPASAAVQTTQTYTSSASDPDGNSIRIELQVKTPNSNQYQTTTTATSPGACLSPCTLSLPYLFDQIGVYNLRTIAYDSNNVSSQNPSGTLQVQVGVPTPTNLQVTQIATGANCQVRFSWSGNSDTGWSIDVSTDPNFSSATRKQLPQGVNSTTGLDGFFDVNSGVQTPTQLYSGIPLYWRLYYGVAGKFVSGGSFQVNNCETNRKPGVPTKPSGPSTVKLDSANDYSASASDPDGDQIKITYRAVNVRTQQQVGASTSGLEPSGCPQGCKVSFTFGSGTNTPGDKIGILAIAIDSKNQASENWSPYLEVTVEAPPQNQVPDKPSTPTGPATAIVGETKTYQSSVSDTEGDPINVLFEYDNTTDNKGAAQLSAGTKTGCKTPCAVTHSFLFPTAGVYKVKVLTLDARNLGQTSDPLTVTVTEPQTTPSPTPEPTPSPQPEPTPSPEPTPQPQAPANPSGLSASEDCVEGKPEITFNWQHDGQNTTGFYLDISTEPSFGTWGFSQLGPEVRSYKWTQHPDDSLAPRDNPNIIHFPADNTLYYWRVKAKGNGADSGHIYPPSNLNKPGQPISTRHCTQTQEPTPPPAVDKPTPFNLESPTNRSEGSNDPQFKWQTSQNARKYYILVGLGSARLWYKSTTATQLYFSESGWSKVDAPNEAPQVLPPGTYTWNVTATANPPEDSLTENASNGPFTFTVPAPPTPEPEPTQPPATEPPPTGGTTPKPPATGEPPQEPVGPRLAPPTNLRVATNICNTEKTAVRVQFLWDASPNGTGYEINWDHSGTVRGKAADTTKFASTSTYDFQSNTPITWWEVRTTNDFGEVSKWKPAPEGFVTDNCDPDEPTATLPPAPPSQLYTKGSKCNQDNTSANITFHWVYSTADYSAPTFKIGWRTSSQSAITDYFVPASPAPTPVWDPITFSFTSDWELTYPGFTPGTELTQWAVIAQENGKVSETTFSDKPAYALDCGGKVSILVHHVDEGGNSYTVAPEQEPIEVQVSSTEGYRHTTGDVPEFNLTGLSAGTYTLIANNPNRGYKVQTAACINSTCSSSAEFKDSGFTTVSLTSGGSFADIYFKHIFTDTGESASEKPIGPIVVADTCEGTQNTAVTFKWYQKPGTTDRFEVAWSTGPQDPIENNWFEPDKKYLAQEKNALGLATGSYYLKYPGFNNGGQPIASWAVRAKYTDQKVSLPAYGDQFIPRDCSNFGGSGSLVQCCTIPPYLVNDKTLETLENIKDFSAQSINEVQLELKIQLSAPHGSPRNSALFLVNNTLQLLKSLNYGNIAVLLRNFGRQREAALDIASFNRIYTLAEQGYSVTSIREYYGKFTNAAVVINEEGLRYLDSAFLNGDLEKYLKCTYGEGGKQPYEIPLNDNCVLPRGMDNSPLLNSHQTLRDISLGGGQITDFVNFADSELMERIYMEEAMLSRLGRSEDNLGQMFTNLASADAISREYLDSSDPLSKTYYQLAKRIEGSAESTAIELYTLVADHFENETSNAAQREIDRLTSVGHQFSVMGTEMIIGLAGIDNFVPFGKPFKLAKDAAIAGKVAKSSDDVTKLGAKIAAEGAVESQDAGVKFIQNVQKAKGAIPATEAEKATAKREIGEKLRLAAGVSVRNTIRRLTDIPGLSNTLISLEGKELWKVFDGASTRYIVFVEHNGIKQAFYKSAQGTSGKLKGGWHPFFGFLEQDIFVGGNLYKEGWLVKFGLDASVYGNNSQRFKEIADILDRELPGYWAQGDIPEKVRNVVENASSVETIGFTAFNQKTIGKNIKGISDISDRELYAFGRDIPGTIVDDIVDPLKPLIPHFSEAKNIDELLSQIRSAGQIILESGEILDSSVAIGTINQVRRIDITRANPDWSILKSLGHPELEKRAGELLYDDFQRTLAIWTDIARSHTFEEIYRALRYYDVITNPQLIEYTAEELIENIDAARRNPALLKTVTRTAGLRDRVAQLIASSEHTVTEIADLDIQYSQGGGFRNTFRQAVGESKVEKIYENGNYQIVASETDEDLINFARLAGGTNDPMQRLELLSKRANELAYAPQTGGDGLKYIELLDGERLPLGTFIRNGGICIDKTIIVKAAIDLLSLMERRNDIQTRIVTGSSSPFTENGAINACADDHAWLEAIVKSGPLAGKILHIDPTQTGYHYPRLAESVYRETGRTPQFIIE